MISTWTNNDIKNSEEVTPLQDTHSTLNNLNNWCSRKCTLNLLKRRLPFTVWLPKYNLEDLKGDLIAGMTVALTVIPQGLAYALLAGLAPQYGLYTAFMGCFMYTLFGSCKDITIGPTAIMSIMTAEHAAAGGITYVILITFLSGCIQLIMGILNLGFLVTFISSSVVSAFTSAAAITIAVTQLPGLFGVSFKTKTFFEDLYHFFSRLFEGNIKYYDMAMGLSSVIFLLFFKYGSKIKFNCCGESFGRIIDIILRTIAPARNALLVLICAGIAAVLLGHDIDVLTLTQEVKPGLPPFAFPEFTYSYFNNATNQTIHKGFLDIVQDMGSGLVIIPLISILEAIAIAKSFAKEKKVDATQEMIAIGASNIMGSFVSSYPSTGSFTRTAINHSSGVRTPAGGILTGSLVLLALGVMSQYFHFIPKASLSALIFMAVISMVHFKDLVVMWRTNKLDLISFAATFILSFVLGLEYGILIGIGVSLLILLLQELRPKILIEERQTFLGCQYLYVRPDRTVLFPSAERLQTKVVKSISDSETSGRLYAVLIDGVHITSVDYTMAMNMKALIDNFKKEYIEVIFVNLKPNVQKAIQGACPALFMEFLTREDAENYIEALSMSQFSPPAYNIDAQSLRSDDVSLR